MNKKLKIISLLILFFAILLFSKSTYCVDGSLKATQTTSGEKITVTITSSKSLGAFTLTCSGLNPIDGESEVGAFGGNTISGASVNGSKNLGKFVFKVPEKDTKVSFSVSRIQDPDGNSLTISSTSITLKAKVNNNTNNNTSDNKTNTNNNTTTTKSSNANLSTLGVTPKEYDFSGFSKNKTSYSVTVPSDVDSLKVVYKTEDSKAKVKVSGNSGFDVGSNNNIKIVVTAENGNSKTYTIKVTKLATEEEKPGNVIEDENKGLYLTSLNIEGLELTPEFAQDTYSYTANLGSEDITELKVDATANRKDINIEISGNKELVEGENIINIVLTVDGSTEQTVYQVVVNKEATIMGASSSSDEASKNDFIGTIKKYSIILIAVILLIIIAVIILIYLLRKENKRSNNDEDEDEDIGNDDYEYDVYKNDINEFENKNKESENFIESLYKQRNKNEYYEQEMNEQDMKTVEDINKQTEEIFNKDKVKNKNEEENLNNLDENNFIEPRKRREKGKHF